MLQCEISRLVFLEDLTWKSKSPFLVLIQYCTYSVEGLDSRKLRWRDIPDVRSVSTRFTDVYREVHFVPRLETKCFSVSGKSRPPQIKFAKR